MASRNGVAFTWDNNGNLLSDGVNTYTYDHADRLVTAQGPLGSLEYRYNGLGDRIQEIADGITTTFTLDLNNPMTQVLADGDLTYLYGLDRIAQEEAAIEHYLPDGLGSARQLSDAAGGITRTASFEPFGALLEATGPSASPYGFTGELHDPLGLIDLRARTYSPELGIFLSRDPFPGVLFSPQTQHAYAYVGANPATFADPSGLFTPWDLLDVASFGWIGGSCRTRNPTTQPGQTCSVEFLVALVELGLSGAVTGLAIEAMVLGFPEGLIFTPLAILGLDLMLFDLQTMRQAATRSCEDMDTDPLILIHVVFPDALRRQEGP